MDSEIEKQVIQKLLLPKKEKLIQQLVTFLQNDIQKLVKDNVEIKVVNFILDMPFTFHYMILPDNHIIDNKYCTRFRSVIDYYEENDSEIMEAIILNYSITYENEHIGEDEILEWASIWKSENEEVEYNFFSDCWIEAKKMIGSDIRALLFEHECWDNSYELDDKIFIDLVNYPEYLRKKGVNFKVYQ